MNKVRRRVLHVIDNLATGGAEKLLVNTITDLSDYDHTLVLLNGPEDLKVELPSNIRYHKLNFNLNTRVIFKIIQFRNIKQLKRIIHKEQPDIIHAHLFWSIFYCRIARGNRSKFFFTIHGMIGDRVFKESFIYRWLEKLSVFKSQHLIAVSKAVLNNYLQYIPFKGKTSIVYNYIPDLFFKYKKSSYSSSNIIFKIVSVGNLKPIKNYKVQIKAMAQLGNHFRLDIYGTGHQEEIYLKDLINEMNISNVYFMGNVSKMHEVLVKYDLFVMSSFSEGHSIALSEAMALAMPVLLSDIASFRETTDDQAVFFDPHNYSELASKIKEFSISTNLRQEAGLKNYKIALKYGKREDYLHKLRILYK